MRIVHVANFYGPRSANALTMARELGAGYRRAGHEFFSIEPGVRSERAHTPSGVRVSVASAPTVRGRRSLVAVDFAVRRVLSELHPDRVEVSDRLTLTSISTWARQHSVPVVLMVDGLPTEARAADVDRVVCTTQRGVDAYEAVSPGRVTRVSPGVDLEEFSPLRWSAEIRRSYIEDADLLFVHVGALRAEHDPATSIAALAELVRCGVRGRLVIVADGPLRATLERSAAGLPVTFIGQIDHGRALAALLAAADVVLSPSPTHTFGFAALEALATGTPVVASVLSAANELGAVSGELAGPSGRDFADAVQHVLLRRVEDRRTDARARAARLPWSATVAAMLAVHESLTRPTVA